MLKFLLTACIAAMIQNVEHQNPSSVCCCIILDSVDSVSQVPALWPLFKSKSSMEFTGEEPKLYYNPEIGVIEGSIIIFFYLLV